ncbi:MAG: DUF2029 domain-containing protein [Candidatus Methanomethylophilus sp.]|nr:DUF2029 domain-containing protein [Methanomethylophilus sp.]
MAFSERILRTTERRDILIFLAIVLVIGFVIRITAGLVLNYGYDVHHWAIIMANASSGNGLYGLTGYFYTPVWGYILGFMNLIQQACLTLGETAFRVPEALGFEGYDGWISANTTSMTYTFWVKLPLYLVDLVVAYLIYLVVLDYTGDRRKAVLGFALWFLNPLVILAPAVQGMFDNITALLTLAGFMCIRRRLYFCTGLMMGLAILLKLFPVFLLPLMVAYVLVKEGRDIRKGLLSVIVAAAGVMIVAAAVFLPQIMDGTLSYCFTFLTARAGGDGSQWDAIAGMGTVAAYLIIIVLCILLALVFYRTAGKDLENEFLRYMLVNLVIMFLFPPTPQYLVLLIPFLTVYAVVSDRGFMRPLVLIAVFASLYILANNFTLLLTLACDSNLIAVATVVSWSDAAAPYWLLLFYGAGALQYTAILYLVWLVLKGRLVEIAALLPSYKRKKADSE